MRRGKIALSAEDGEEDGEGGGEIVGLCVVGCQRGGGKNYIGSDVGSVLVDDPGLGIHNVVDA